MWDIVILGQIDNLFLVMSPNGDTEVIDKETLNKFMEQKKNNYEKD